MREQNKKQIIALVANSTWNIYNFRLNLIDKFLAEGMDVVVIAPVDEYLTIARQKQLKDREYFLGSLRRFEGSGQIFLEPLLQLAYLFDRVTYLLTYSIQKKICDESKFCIELRLYDFLNFK